MVVSLGDMPGQRPQAGAECESGSYTSSTCCQYLTLAAQPTQVVINLFLYLLKTSCHSGLEA